MTRDGEEEGRLVWDTFGVLLPFIAASFVLIASREPLGEPLLGWAADGFLMAPATLFLINGLQILHANGWRTDRVGQGMTLVLILLVSLSCVEMTVAIQQHALNARTHNSPDRWLAGTNVVLFLASLTLRARMPGIPGMQSRGGA